MLDRLNRILAWLHRFFDDTDALQQRMSDRWTEHTNRRTIMIVIVLGALGLYAYLFLIRPPANFPAGHMVTVEAGQGLSAIATNLQNQGVIRSRIAFRTVATLSGKGRDMKAGDYVFKEPRTLWNVIRTISIGAYGLEPVRVRVPEGATVRQMAVIFASQFERFDQAKFLADAQPLEGYLFPDTYNFLPNVREDVIIKTMRDRFDGVLHASSTSGTTLAEQIEQSGHTLNDVVIMASIVEREGIGRDNDREMIAGILWNRIEKGMALQVDAVFLYTLGKATFSLTREDLKTASPYNTYLNKGLPPTPIGSPSYDSLRAAANPIKNNYLFYLADSRGNTYYSRTYQQHLIKKDAYIDN